jgi:plastocyanin
MQLGRTLKSVFAVALLVLASGLILSQRGAVAQDAESHPAHIHSGTCGDGLGDVVFPLSDVSESVLVNGTPIAGAVGGATDAVPVAVSGTTVASSLADLLAAPFAINVHESAENIGNYIACGNIGGALIGTSDIAIGLAELNESGYNGVATLHDNGDGTTAVSVYLVEEVSMAGGEEEAADTEAAATEAVPTEAAPTEEAAAAPAGNQVAVSIVNFLYDPSPVNVAVGDTVTWTNNDTVPHTVTANDGSFQSGTMQPGATFSFTFTGAGTFDYHCEFHANMSGQVVVA